MFGDPECRDQLRALLAQIESPVIPIRQHYPDRVVAAIAHLDQMLEFIRALLDGDDEAFADRYQRGRAELRSLADGTFNYVGELGSRDGMREGGIDGVLAFELLPPGEWLQRFRSRLLASGGSDRVLDPKRTDVLDRLRRRFGDAHCRLYQGAFPASGDDNLYVVLEVVRRRGEDAVAISPLRGAHATYVVRHDSKLPWREVLSRSKRDAKDHGARCLKFAPGPAGDTDEYQRMFEKIVDLLENTARQSLVERVGNFFKHIARGSF